MAIPKPRNGAVLRYAYLWKAEQDTGRSEAHKDRPATVILAHHEPKTGIETVYVLPITHSPPAQMEAAKWAVEIPSDEKARLGLDGDRSWIICSEVNRFLWPGYDVRPIPGSRPPQWEYGMLSRETYEKAKRLFLECSKDKKTKIAVRDA